MDSAAHTRILAHAEHRRPVLVWRVAYDTFLGVLAGSRTVVLSLDSPTGSSIAAPATATLTILDKQSAGTVQFATAPSAETLSGETLPLTFHAFWNRAISRMKRRCWCSGPTGS